MSASVESFLFTAPGADPANSFGIYVHTPFCVHRCSYCDFFSLTQSSSGDRDVLVARVEREIGEAASWMRAEGMFSSPAVSLFFGGGTPSLLPMDSLVRLYRALFEHFSIQVGAEITIEANPETVDEAFCRGLRERTPVNRVSLGAQSFFPEHLKTLERLGSPESIRTAAKRLKAHGFDRFNLDLIFGIPGQTQEQMLEDIDRAAELGPSHVSFYSLTLKPGHPLYGRLPSDDEAADRFEAGIERLASHGLLQYEISNFARPGFESRHNLLYWSGGDFLGVGPSASCRFFRDGLFRHRRGIADLAAYLKMAAFPAPGFENTTREQTVLEAAFLELRKNAGISLGEFQARYGRDLTSAVRYPLFEREGLLARAGDNLRLTARGRLLADSVCRDLVDFS